MLATRRRLVALAGAAVAALTVVAVALAVGHAAAAVPQNPEATTDSAGWASITMQRTLSMPTKRGGALVLFVRAQAGRRPARGRLVQVGISP